MFLYLQMWVKRHVTLILQGEGLMIPLLDMYEYTNSKVKSQTVFLQGTTLYGKLKRWFCFAGIIKWQCLKKSTNVVEIFKKKAWNWTWFDLFKDLEIHILDQYNDET